MLLSIRIKCMNNHTGIQNYYFAIHIPPYV